MKTFKKAIALVLCLMMVFSMASIAASAATVSASLGYNEAENSGDWAYWSGSKVVKSSSTTKDEIKWMQTALNYCRTTKGLNSERLTVDGSFGPASKAATIVFQKATGLSADGKFGPDTIKKMKSVLNSKNTFFTQEIVGRPTATNTPTPAPAPAFTKKNILQIYASSSSDYISGDWYSYSKNGATIKGSGCGIVSLVSAVYNLGGTIDEADVGKAIKDVCDWAYANKDWGKDGVLDRYMISNADDKFGNTYGFTISGQYGKSGKANSSLDALVEHLKNGGTAVVHVNNHYMAAVGYRTNNGKVELQIFDPGADSGSRRGTYTHKKGDWISLDVLTEGSVKNYLDFKKYVNTKSQENIEIDNYWLVSKK